MTEITCTLITAFAGLIVALLTAITAKSKSRDEKRAILRQRESLLSLKMMDATLLLSAENATGILSGNNFDNIQAALDKANSVSNEYQEFMQEVTANQIGK